MKRSDGFDAPGNVGTHASPELVTIGSVGHERNPCTTGAADQHIRGVGRISVHLSAAADAADSGVCPMLQEEEIGVPQTCGCQRVWRELVFPATKCFAQVLQSRSFVAGVVAGGRPTGSPARGCELAIPGLSRPVSFVSGSQPSVAQVP